MRFIFFILLLLTLPLTLGAAPTSNTQKSLGAFGAWQAYSYADAGQPVCYMVQQIHFAKNKKIKRAPSYFMVTHRPAENSKSVISYTSGYNFKTGSDVSVRVDKGIFSLFTQKDTGWSRDPATDRAITKALRSGTMLSLTGIPATPAKSKTVMIDKMELKGADAAYRAISKACGVELDTSPSQTPTKAAAKATAHKAVTKKTAHKGKSHPKPSPRKH